MDEDIFRYEMVEKVDEISKSIFEFEQALVEQLKTQNEILGVLVTEIIEKRK